MLTDVITLLTLVLPRERIEPRCRFRTIRCHKVQKCVFWTFYARGFLDLKDPICQGSRARGYEANKDLDCPRHAQTNSFWSYPLGIVLAEVLKSSREVLATWVDSPSLPLSRLLSLHLTTIHLDSPLIASLKFGRSLPLVGQKESVSYQAS
jgi:hypothetical protein